MRWLAAILFDDRLCGLLESDLRQFYGADLRDLWRQGSGMTYRWLIGRIRDLPPESRFVKHLRQESGHTWDQADHHRQDIIDLLTLILYYSRTGAISGFTTAQQRRIDKGAPERALRPGEKKSKPQMTSKEELKQFFGAV